MLYAISEVGFFCSLVLGLLKKTDMSVYKFCSQMTMMFFKQLNSKLLICNRHKKSIVRD